ncbi:MAG: hypothetical protein L0216_02525, partial [Planctomycetales bacterium]|nr:hypothetical protein [Planctomycetales bacterium]
MPARPRREGRVYTTGPTLDEDAVRRLAGEAATAAARTAFANQGKALLEEMQSEVRRSLGKALLDLSAAWGETGGVVPEDVLREMVRVVRAEVAESGGATGLPREALIEVVRAEVARIVATLEAPSAAPAAAPAGLEESRVRELAREVAEEAAAAAVASLPKPVPTPPAPAGPDEAAVRRIAREEAIRQAEGLRAAVGSSPSASLGAPEVLGMIRRAIEDAERLRPAPVGPVDMEDVRRVAEEVAVRAAKSAVPPPAPPPAPPKLDEGRIRAIAEEVVRATRTEAPAAAPRGPTPDEVQATVRREVAAAIAAAEERRPPSLSAAELRRIAEETAVRAARSAAVPAPPPGP